MNIISPAFGQNELIPAKYTCEGTGGSPPLMFSEVPSGAVSLALVMDDPDAPHGTFTHWLLYNMSPRTASLLENNVPLGSLQGMNSAGQARYIGPCPPSGAHRYIFTLYALNSMLELEQGVSLPELESAFNGRILERATLVGLYQKTGA